MSQLYKNRYSGKTYRQICISNSTATRHNWLVTMVYQDVDTGEIWSRRLDKFLEANCQFVEKYQEQCSVCLARSGE